MSNSDDEDTEKKIVKARDFFPQAKVGTEWEFTNARECLEWLANYGGSKVRQYIHDMDYRKVLKTNPERDLNPKYVLPPTPEEMPVPYRPKCQHKHSLTVRTDPETGDTIVFNIKTGKRMKTGTVCSWGGLTQGKPVKNPSRMLLIHDKKRIDGIVTQQTIQANLVNPALERLRKLIDSDNEIVAQKSVDTVLKYAGIPKNSTITHEVGGSFADLLRQSANVYERRERLVKKDVEDAVEIQYRRDPRYRDDVEE